MTNKQNNDNIFTNKKIEVSQKMLNEDLIGI